MKLLNKFKDFKNIANINILICYKVLFSLKGIKYNIGFYITISIGIMHLLYIIIFYKKQLNLLENKIEDIKFGINNYDLVKNPKLIKKKEKEKEKKLNKKKIILI